MFATLAVTLACAGVTLPPSSPPEQLKPALRCLVNQQRALRGEERLRGSRKLHVAAQAHAEDMRARNVFEHGDVLARVLDAGFEEPLYIGEALAAGCGGLGTPQEIFNALMESPPHRRILMGREFRRMAIATLPWIYNAEGCPEPGLYVLDLIGPV